MPRPPPQPLRLPVREGPALALVHECLNDAMTVLYTPTWTSEDATPYLCVSLRGAAVCGCGRYRLEWDAGVDVDLPGSEG